MDRDEEILQNLIKRVYHLEQEVIRLGGQPYKKEETPRIDENVKDKASGKLASFYTSPAKRGVIVGGYIWDPFLIDEFYLQ